MPSAIEVANALAIDFLREGNYSAVSGPVEIQRPLSAASASAASLYQATEQFSGLEVQSVAHEVGSDEPRVFIYLTRGSMKMIRALPTEVGGVTVVARKVGNLTIRPEAAATATNRGNYYERSGRICCGSSCAPTSENCSGTIGALVRRPDENTLYLLSNNHVFGGCNHVPKGQPILSPSSNDGRPGISAPREVGRHEEIKELRSGTPEFVSPCDSDVALARVTDPLVVSSWQGDDASGYDTPSTVGAPASRLSVKKFGRTSGLTRGALEAEVSVGLPVTYNSRHFKGVIWFDKVWSVRGERGTPFALAGDSGSLVVTNDGASTVGLVFAAGPFGDAWIIPMANISEAFGGLQLVSGYGI